MGDARWKLRTPDEVLAQTVLEYSRAQETMKCAVRGCKRIGDDLWVPCPEHYREVMKKGEYKVSLNPKMREAWAKEAASGRWNRKEWGTDASVS